MQPPAIRLWVLGPHGAGKTMHGRELARKLGLYHIQFRERLQELVIAKTKKRVRPEREEEQELEEQDLPPEEVEEWVAIASITCQLIFFFWEGESNDANNSIHNM